MPDIVERACGSATVRSCGAMFCTHAAPGRTSTSGVRLTVAGRRLQEFASPSSLSRNRTIENAAASTQTVANGTMPAAWWPAVAAAVAADGSTPAAGWWRAVAAAADGERERKTRRGNGLPPAEVARRSCCARRRKARRPSHLTASAFLPAAGPCPKVPRPPSSSFLCVGRTLRGSEMGRHLVRGGDGTAQSSPTRCADRGERTCCVSRIRGSGAF
jgi:hypothetical protein